MKVEKRITTNEEQVYIAEDGTEFAHAEECHCYEMRRRTETAIEKAEATVKRAKDIDDYLPFTGDEFDQYSSYNWFFVEDQNAANILNEAYFPDDPRIKAEDIGNWVCIEANNGDAWAIRFDDCVNYAKEVFEALGYKMTIEPADV